MMRLQKMKLLSEKKRTLCHLYERVNHHFITECEIQQIATKLVGCFSSDPEVRELSCKILAILMKFNSFIWISINVFRKLFCYLPFFFQQRPDFHRDKATVLQLLAQCIQQFTEKCHLIGQLITEFPFSMLLHLSMLIVHQYNRIYEQEVIEFIFQTLQIIRCIPKQHKEANQKISRKLILSVYTIVRNRETDSLIRITKMQRLAECLITNFLMQKPTKKQYWIEHIIENIYGVVFDILANKIYHSSAAISNILTSLQILFQQDFSFDLKLEIIQSLLEHCGGIAKALKLLNNLKNTNLVQLSLYQALVVEMFSHLVWQYEFGSTQKAFPKLKSQFHMLVLTANWQNIIEADFCIPHLRKEGIITSNLWLMVLVGYFQLKQAKYQMVDYATWEKNQALNLISLISICSARSYTIPMFLTKYILEGIVNLNHHDVMQQNEPSYKEKLQQIVPMNFPRNIFGFIPARIPRLKWFKSCNHQWQAKFIHRQRIEALEEGIISINKINATLLDYFPMELLFEVLCANRSSLTAQINASTIMSQIPLSQEILEKIINEKLTIRRGCHSRWLQYLRALFGSLNIIYDKQQDKVIAFLIAKINSNNTTMAVTPMLLVFPKNSFKIINGQVIQFNLIVEFISCSKL